MSGKREDLEIVIGANLDGLAADLNRGAGMVKKFHADVAKASPSASDFAGDNFAIKINLKDFHRAKDVVKDMGFSLRGAASELAGFVGKAAIAGGTLLALEAGFSGVSSVIDQLKSSVSMAAELEQNTIAFEVMQGSAAKATETLKELRDFAASTPFSSKEVIKSAKLLTGMGTTAEDLIPTLKMLGHHASVDPKNAGLERMAYLFGTMQTTGRVFTKDLNQLTMAGIDINPDLAKQLKVEMTDIRKLAEEGAINFEDTGRAMEAMTLKGGRLHGILDKQAKSLLGSWEQMLDAFDLAKVKLGQIIIEETGLVGVVKDLELFGHGLGAGMDTRGLREGIRFAGDLAKGGAQIAYEFGKAGVAVASISLDGLSQVSPQIASLATSIKDVVGGLQSFRLDERQIATFGISLFRAIAHPLAYAADWIQVEGKAYADGFQKNFIDPANELNEAFKRVRDSMNNIRDAADKVLDPDKSRTRIDRDYLRDVGIAAPVGVKKDGWAPATSINGVWQGPTRIVDWVGRNGPNADKFKSLEPETLDYSLVSKAADVVRNAKEFSFAPPHKTEMADNIVFRFKHLQRLMNDADQLVAGGHAQFKPFRDQFFAANHEFLKAFSDAPERDFGHLLAQFQAGKAPAFRAGWEPPAPAEGPKNVRDTLSQRIDQFESSFFASFNANKMAGGFAKMWGSVDKVDAAERANAFAGMLGGAGSVAKDFGGGADGAGINWKDKPRQSVIDLAEKLRDQFDPLAEKGKLMRAKKEMEEAMKFGLITPDQFNQGWHQEVKGVADKMGVGGPTKLQDAALVGSTEDARLLASFMAGGEGQKNTDELLRMIEQHLASIRRTNFGIEKVVTQPVVRDYGGGVDF